MSQIHRIWQIYSKANFHLCSLFSDPNNPDIKESDFQPPEISTPMIEDHSILRDDNIIEAIKKIPNASSHGLVGIPAILLKNCASELCLPIKNDMVRVV